MTPRPERRRPDRTNTRNPPVAPPVRRTADARADDLDDAMRVLIPTVGGDVAV